jgi:hypothetical protein
MYDNCIKTQKTKALLHKRNMIIFVGDVPSSYNIDSKIAFKGAKCEKHLMDWIESIGVLKDEFILINQIEVSYAWFVTAHARNNKLIALGNNASKSIRDIPHFKLPHPSGRNRQINDLKLIKIKLKECEKWLQSSS